MGSFSDSILANSNIVLQEVNDKCFSIAKQLFRLIVQNTPSPSNPGTSATGLLVNQWYPQAGGFSSEKSSATSPTGSDSLARINSMPKTEFLKKDGRLTLTNNLHYAYRAEMLGWPESDGWSGRVGPYRMVAKSLQAIAARNNK